MILVLLKERHHFLDLTILSIFFQMGMAYFMTSIKLQKINYTQNKLVCENLNYQFIHFEYNGDRIICKINSRRYRMNKSYLLTQILTKLDFSHKGFNPLR
jgi:hypothetical protein